MDTMSQPQPLSVGSGSSAFNVVNPHCLDHIVGLAKTHEVIADDDIHDERGVKLWAKGCPVSQTLHEKLLRRRLSQPLESSLNVKGGASLELIIGDTLALIDELPAFAALSGSSDARGLLRDVQKLPLPGPVRLLLTSAREKQHSSFKHSLATMATCAGLASHLGLSPQESSMLFLSALVHDIGEMYVNPEYLDGSKVLAPAEWKHVAAHPCVSNAFVRDFTRFPAAVAEGVLHHHERRDGSGYPFQIADKALSRLGAILAVADSVSAIIIRGGRGLRKRVEVALCIVPEEFNGKAVSAINVALRSLDEENCTAGEDDCLDLIAPVLEQLASARLAAESLVAEHHSTNVYSVGRYVLAALGNIEKSLRATGISEPSQLVAISEDPQILGEICLILRETKWRLRNLARNVHLRIENTGIREEMNSVASLLAALDTIKPTQD